MSNLIDKTLSVICPICNSTMKQLTPKHLKQHRLTTEQFKINYPECYTIHPTRKKQAEEARKKGKAKKENQKVEKPCWNYTNCNNKILVNINVPNRNITCEECKTKELFHPDFIKQKEKLSQHAKQLNQDPEIIKKRTESLRNRTPEEIKAWKTKRENTLSEKEGPNWKQKGYKKTKAGMLRLYGKEHALQVDKFRQKANDTTFQNWGVRNIMELDEKVKEVFGKRDQPAITAKTINTNMEKYGGRGPMCNSEVVEKGKYTRFTHQQLKILKYLQEIGFEIIGEYKHAHKKTIFKHIGGCGYEWKTNWNNLWNRSRFGNPCPNCKPKNTNNKIAQKNVQVFLESLGFNPLVDNRILLGDGRELDFIIEEEKVCIEYCGLYWHSEKMLNETRKIRAENYHLSKLEICENKGYKLITIFEDEWVEKQDIVKARLSQILNRSSAKRVHARKCKIKNIDKKTKNSFLNTFHIQGCRDSSSLYYGAIDSDKNLIAIMTFGKPRGVRSPSKTEWEIKRFCTNFEFHSTGIAKKLLKHFQRNIPWSYIVTYADRRWSNGDLYSKMGFFLENKGFPAKWFTDCNRIKRYHRSIMWKTKEDIESGLTQDQLAVIKGFRSIFDCGSLKFSIVNTL